MNKILHLFLFLNFTFTVALGQRQRCHTMENEAIVRSNDPSYDFNREAFKNQIDDYLAATQNQRNASVIYEIRVVVHVVYKTPAENIPDSQIFDQIDILDKDYSRTNTDATNTRAVFDPIVGATNIRFRLADTDPSGAATTGITRTPVAASCIFTVGNEVKSAPCGVAPWDVTRYLNIWVCDLSGGVLGYAQFPGGPAATDGVVLGYMFTGNTADPTYNKGRTATHEVGHYLGLKHIWGDSPGCSPDDDIADTPISNDKYFGCPTGDPNTCGSGTPPADYPDMHENYMDYTDDACMNAFTNGQKDVMEATLNTSRPDIWEVGSGGPAPTVGCTPVPVPFFEGFETSTGLPPGWTAFNPDGGVTWQRNASVSHTGGASFFMDNFNYAGGTGKKDAIATPALHTDEITGDKLKFWYAYAQYQSGATTRNDKMTIYLSADCGINWYNVWEYTGAFLATAPATDIPFVPTPSQWKQDSTYMVNLNLITNYKIECTSGNGNQLYVDDINLSGPPNGLKEVMFENMMVYPNPTNTGLLTLEANIQQNLTIRLLNLQGQLLQEETIAFDGLTILDYSKFAAGLYILDISSNDHHFTKKITKE